MKPLKNIRISQKAREQLIQLKRHTGLQHWNELCRWAFCLSIADETVPLDSRMTADSSIEMTWEIFSGNHGDIYMSLLKQRCYKDNVEINPENLLRYCKLHIHRGIDKMSKCKTLTSLLKLIDLN
ncbi:DNA sulfur modification protein DndE [Geomonas nitrogeniifigens]|uniref:DNA sulfur modification protein DndE n=1 Tax=Geomonas diazotrophica TaxID=2843197 RepID=A0ABX8JNQ0_9BACT|nr:DNA sulfur modification protein DndE [Geomonas nitrogeniifigens]QWV98229.1 DNA sulfur modification protein DndE [Geomonas nitrogeniifigens]